MRELILNEVDSPTENETVIVDAGALDLGGPALNVTWHLAAMDIPVDLVTCCDERDLSRLRALLEGVDVDLRSSQQFNGSTDVLVSYLTKGVHHSVYLLGEPTPQIVTHVSGIAQTASIVVLNGGRHALYRRAYLETVKSRVAKQRIIFSPSYAIVAYDPHELEYIVDRSDIVIVNTVEYDRLNQLLDWDEREESWLGEDRILIITKGRRGAEARTAESRIQMRSKVDRVGLFLGAGDALVSGVVYGVTCGCPANKCLDLGLRAAAAVVDTGRIRAVDVKSYLASEELES